ncbi:MAG: hypothetical protein FRX49_09747 [Trebouxia sp. A1-2]|nr:MAG: hypothetical protein FRX49_09747 [Trebouxia sp. A1-2]
MDKLVLQAVEEVALEGPEGDAQQPPHDSLIPFASLDNERFLASAEARDMALGLYERDPVHPLNPDMRKTLELTGKSRTRGAVQPDVARICNVPHKNFFIVVKTLEIHNLVIRSDIQVRNSKGTMSKTSILHLPRFSPKLDPGLQFAKQGSEDKLYAVTDDDATVAYLLKCMREMDPEGVGIVRSEFKKYTLSRMHSGSLRQNHRLWRRLQTKMQKQGVLELDVHMVQGSERTTIRAVKPSKDGSDERDSANYWPLVAEQSFAREFFHIVLNAGEEGIVMSELGRHLQFPIRTFHKPNYLKEFTTRLGLYACKEQRGKTVVVCVHAPQKLLDEYRQSHAPTGPWLQNGWLNAVHNAMDTSLAGLDAPADPAVPIITATPLEGGPSLAQGSGMDEPPQQQPQQQQLEAQSGQQAEQSMSAKGCVAVEGMPTIPEAAEAQVDSGEEAEIAQKGQIAAERRQMAEEEMQTMQPWISDQSKIALDRIRRLLEQLDDAGFLFKSALRRFLKDTDPGEVAGNGPDSKTIERYLEALCRHGKAQKLVIPVTLTTSTVVTKDMLAYVKPHVQVNDALIEQLVAKWRAISSAHRSEGVHNFYQAIRQKAPPVDRTQAGKVPYKPVRPGRPAHIIDNSQGLVNRLYENGYIRPKMIRIRLLHYWICRLLGLGGYERLAEADGQLAARPKEHVFMFRAAMPDSNSVKTTAQLTDGSASWASPNSFTARQLWEWMPVDIFVQTFGTTNNVPNLSELTSSGVRLRKLNLTPFLLIKLLDLNVDRRTKQHIEILRCLGLVESVVIPESGDRPVPLAPTVASRYVALNKGIIEVRKDESRPASAEGSSSGEFVQRAFDLTTQDGLEGYWAQLAQMSVDYSKPNQGPASKAWKQPPWFPSTTVSDILTRRAWNTLHVMTLEQSHALKEAFNKAADETGYVSWLKCMQIAKDLDLEYEQVNTLSNMRKARLGRLDPVFKNKNKVQTRTYDVLPPELVALHEAKSRASIAKRLTAQGVSEQQLPQLVEEQIEKNRRLRERQMLKKQGIPTRKRRRKAIEANEQQQPRSYLSKAERRRREQASRVDDGELGPGFVPRRAPRASTKHKDISEGDNSDPDMVVKRHKNVKRHKKGPDYKFSMEEDNAILRSFARWRTHRSPEYFVNFRRFQLPVSLESAKRRCYKALSRYSETQAHMDSLKELCIDVYHRHHARKVAAWQARQASMLAEEGAVAAAAEKQQIVRPEAAAAAVASTAAKDASGEGGEAVAAGPAGVQPDSPAPGCDVVAVKGKRKQKRSQYLSTNQLNSVMNTFMAIPEERSVSPITMSTSSIDKPAQPDSHPLPVQPAQSPVPLSDQKAVQSVVQSPGLSPLHSSRPLLDPYEPLFAVEDDEDAKALEEIEGVIQLILDLTPRKESRPEGQRKRQKSEGVEDYGMTVRKKRRSRSVTADMADGDLQGGEAAASVLKGRAMSRSWKRTVPLPARGPLQMPGVQKPNVVEAHAMELIKSMLYLADATGLAEHDVVGAVSQRFTGPEITAALAFLQQQGLVNYSGVKRPLMLSKLFAEHMEVLDFPQQLPAEALEASHLLSSLLQPKNGPSTSGWDDQSPAAVLNVDDGDQVTGGMVCEALTLMAAGRLNLRPGSVKVECSVLPQLSSSASEAVRGATGPVKVDVPLTLTACSGTALSLPEGAQQPHLGCSMVTALPESLQQLPDVSMDMDIAAVRSNGNSFGAGAVAQPAAEQRQTRKGKKKGRSGGQQGAKAEVARENGHSDDAKAKQPRPALEHQLAELHRHISETGATGITGAQLQDKLTGDDQQHSNGTQTMAALDTLLDRQLVCWAPSFDQEVLMSTDLVGRLTCGFRGPVADESGPGHDFQSLAGLQAEKSTKDSCQKSSSHGEEGTENHQAQSPDETDQKASINSRAAVASVSKAGSHGQGAEGHCLLRPWLNHEGQLNEPFWSGLTRRTLSVVMRNPGIPEELLIGQIQALTPQQAKALIELMTAQGVLKQQTITKIPETAVPSILGSSQPVVMLVTHHYFAAAGAGFGALSELFVSAQHVTAS